MRSPKILPFAILGFAALVVFFLYLAARTPEEHAVQSLAPLVRISIAEPTRYQFFVTAHGSVSPRTESDLIPQVSGEVVWMSPALVAGGFFQAGEVLARVDTADYRVDREAARAAVARATSEHGRAKKELDRQGSLADRSVASQSRIDDAENAYRVADASLREARARLERAERDLARTDLKAPYRGRVRSEQVDVGQFVTRGAPIGRLYAVDYAEIRLPVPDRELAYLDIPLIPQIRDADDPEAEVGSRVSLSAEFAGRMHHWEGRLVRTEGELDPRSRMIQLVARVRDPYGLEKGLEEDAEASAAESVDDDLAENAEIGVDESVDAERTAPLAVGLFVEAEIEGQAVERAFVISRDALIEGDRVWVVDAEDQIHARDVEVLRRERENVIVGAGLAEGDRVCTSPLEAAIDGMRVRVLLDGASLDETDELANRAPTDAEAVQ